MKISIDKNLVKELLVMEDFFNKVPEYFYLKEAGSKINEALGQQGGCSACTENNLTPWVLRPEMRISETGQRNNCP